MTATEIKKLASDLGLTITGNYKDGYRCVVSHTGSEWLEIIVNIESHDAYKVHALLKGMSIIATDENIDSHWAICKMIEADQMIEKHDNQYFIDEFGIEVHEDSYEDSEKDSWYQNEIDTTSWVFDKNPGMYNFNGTIEEYLESLGEEWASDKTWLNSCK